MADDQLSTLERRWRATGSADDEAAYLSARLRTGTLDRRCLEVAAYCEHEAASRALGLEATSARPDLAAWADGLSEWGRVFERQLALVCGKAALRHAVNLTLARTDQHEQACERALQTLRSAMQLMVAPTRERYRECQRDTFLASGLWSGSPLQLNAEIIALTGQSALRGATARAGRLHGGEAAIRLERLLGREAAWDCLRRSLVGAFLYNDEFHIGPTLLLSEAERRLMYRTLRALLGARQATPAERAVLERARLQLEIDPREASDLEQRARCVELPSFNRTGAAGRAMLLLMIDLGVADGRNQGLLDEVEPFALRRLGFSPGQYAQWISDAARSASADRVTRLLQAEAGS